VQAEEILRYHSHGTSTAAFQRFKPHLLVPGIVPPASAPGVHSVEIYSPLFRHCQRLCETGGSYNDHNGRYNSVAGFRLVQVQAVVHDNIPHAAFDARQHKLSRLRMSDQRTLFNPNVSDFTSSQFSVLSMLREQFLERPPGTQPCAPNSFYCFHGPRPENLYDVCMNGVVGTRSLDGGYFGSGCYATLNIEYALRYVHGDFDERGGYTRRFPAADGRYAVVMLAACTGATYPITPEVDYDYPLTADRPSAVSTMSPPLKSERCKYFGSRLKTGYDCHVVCVNEANGLQAVSKKDCQYIEVVMDQEWSLLPVAVLWFEVV
jgi:hypothetical protein